MKVTSSSMTIQHQDRRATSLEIHKGASPSSSSENNNMSKVASAVAMLALGILLTGLSFGLMPFPFSVAFGIVGIAITFSGFAQLLGDCRGTHVVVADRSPDIIVLDRPRPHLWSWLPSTPWRPRPHTPHVAVGGGHVPPARIPRYPNRPAPHTPHAGHVPVGGGHR